MATSTVDAQAAGQAGTSVSPAGDNFYQEKETIVIGFDIELSKQEDGTFKPVMKDGQPKRSFGAYGYNNEKQINTVKALEEKGAFESVAILETSVNLPKNWDGLMGLYDTDEKKQEGVNNHNRGAAQKVTNRRNGILSKALTINDKGEPEFDESVLTGSTLVLDDQIADPSQRKVLTEEEKVARFLETLPPAVQEQMRAAYAAARK